jgi:hypothetical protein
LLGFFVTKSVMTAENHENAGAPETDITPEMIDARAEVIWTYFYDVVRRGSQIGREAAVEVYRAMRCLEKLAQNAVPPQSQQASLGDRDAT